MTCSYSEVSSQSTACCKYSDTIRAAMFRALLSRASGRRSSQRITSKRVLDRTVQQSDARDARDSILEKTQSLHGSMRAIQDWEIGRSVSQRKDTAIPADGRRLSFRERRNAFVSVER